MELRELPVVFFIVCWIYILWIGSGPARDERRAKKAKR
jgi:hypothetical protein